VLLTVLAVLVIEPVVVTTVVATQKVGLETMFCNTQNFKLESHMNLSIATSIIPHFRTA
jgi:hypothetical protein